MDKNYQLTEEEKNLFSIMRKGDLERCTFFNRANGFKWFHPVREEGFFSPKYVEAPYKVEDRYGTRWTVPYWCATNYLNRLSWELGTEEGKPFQPYMADIMNDVTDHLQKKGFCNYNVWIAFVQILTQMDTKYINDKMIDNIGYWVESKFGDTPWFVQAFLLPKLLDENTPISINISGEILKQVFWRKKVKTFKGKTQLEKYNNFEKSWSKEIFDQLLHQRQKHKVYATKGLVDFHDGLATAFEMVRTGVLE